MKTRSLLVFTFTVILTFLLGAGLGLGAPVMNCSDIASLSFSDETFDRPVVFKSASIVDATDTVPSHCLVEGKIWPEIEFALRMPTEWNGKFRHHGGGGFDGYVPNTSGDMALGFASFSTNGGHSSLNPFAEPALFAYNPPDNSNPNANQKVIDFGTRAHQQGAILAKKLIRTYYDADPSRSYWIGCSNGGHEGMMMAQRYPELFDGYLIGAPVANFSGQSLLLIWNAQALYGDGWIAKEKLGLLAEAVYAKCDGIDGLVDGLIDDPRKCTFNPSEDLPNCPDDVDASDCFTSAQADALKKIYEGANVAGVGGNFMPLGSPVGSEFMLNGVSGWEGTIWAAQNTAHLFGETFVKYMAFDPPAGPDYDWRTFDFTNDADPLRVVASGLTEKIDAVDPNLQAAKASGAKIFQYHGWADPLVVPAISWKYYDAVLSTIGEAETKEFYKLYMIPGAGHCGGGIGCFDNQSDLSVMFEALVEWVENDVEPKAVTGHRMVGDEVVRTRPLCPYPEVAVYSGSGSIDDGANFACRDLTHPPFFIQ